MVNPGHELRCSKCKTGFIPFDDFESCEAEIINCKEGDSPSSRTCKVCNDLHLRSSDKKSCTSYKTEDCKTYNSSSGICTECNQGYIINPADNTYQKNSFI